MKEEGVTVAEPSNSRDTEEKAEESASQSGGFSTPNASSKYDFVKLMELQGYGEEYINRYKMMTRFHHQRVPLVILVCGTACSGKSTIATQLAQRLNLPNVLQNSASVDFWHFVIVIELSREQLTFSAPLAPTPVWEHEFSSSKELITEFCRECRIVHKGGVCCPSEVSIVHDGWPIKRYYCLFPDLAGDLKKAMKDGKPIIIEEKQKKQTHASDNSVVQMENNAVNTCQIPSATNHQCAEIVSSQETVASHQMNEVSNSLESIKIEESVPEGETLKNAKTDKFSPVRKEKYGAEAMVIPIVFRMAEFDHKALLEEWIATRTYKDKDELISNLKTIQDYLCKFESQGLTVVNISATTFPQTLDWLHGYLLQCIEQGISCATGETPKEPLMSSISRFLSGTKPADD
ncbi:hypothetical protein Ancab_008745 [Ancistrocladus abbreviatus]